jgi:tryptophanyl-tRNA synthetase
MNHTTYVAGCRASGKLHIGNYLGLITQLLETQAQENTNRFFFIADLHGITTPFEPKELTQNTLDIAATYIAAGIDPHKTTFFLQNHVLEHASLAWIFNCITPLGELERMTQYKEKSVQHKESINAGLLTYPCLMAADILLYKPSAVPVGEDQIQHVELARVVARKFNNRFGEVFPEPKPYLQKPLRITSLTNPEKKMGKTGDEGLLMEDEPTEIHRKLKKAVTATEADGKSAGVENLLGLLAHFGSQANIAHFSDAQQTGALKFSELKEALATDIAEYFAEFREKKKELLGRPEYLAEVLGEGARKAREVAEQTLCEVKEKVGLL